MRNRISFLLVVAIFLLSVVGGANAAIVSNLNVAAVPVLNASASTRQAAMPKALGQVLIKMSGNPSVMTLPAVQNALDDMDALIQSYAYDRQLLQAGSTQLILRVTFDAKAVKQLLRKAGQADWSRDRPLTLLWFQIQNNQISQILSNTDDSLLSDKVQKAAQARGIPIVLPAMDLQDQNFIKQGVNTLDSELLQRAAERYGAAIVLGGSIQKVANEWHGKWLLLMDDTPFRWSSTADSLSALCQQAVSNTANLMANQLAVANNKALETDVILDVSNVMGLDDYAKVLLTLKRLAPVAGVSVIDMKGNHLLLTVKTVGGEQTLSEALSSQQRFTALENMDNTSSKANLFYRWDSGEHE